VAVSRVGRDACWLRSFCRCEDLLKLPRAAHPEAHQRTAGPAPNE
jgi:hypothetical protein